MIAPDRALELVLSRAKPLPRERVPLSACAGRVLAADVRAAIDLPVFESSAMDGYAVRARDCAGAGSASRIALSVRAVLRAGSRPASLRPGEAFKIMTGAPLPRGADAVVMKERAAEDAGGVVLIARAPRPGEHVRKRGEDVSRGAPLLRKGARLRPYEVALLAAQGFAHVPVVKRPRVAILPTGDELCPAVSTTPTAPRWPRPSRAGAPFLG